MNSKVRLKEKILKELYESGHVQRISSYNCQKYGLDESFIDDISQEIFYRLYKMKPELIIKHHKGYKKRNGYNTGIYGLVIKVCEWAITSSNQDNPNRSLLRLITTFSNFKHIPDKKGFVLTNVSEKEFNNISTDDYEKDKVQIFLNSLSKEDLDFIDYINEKGVGRRKTEDLRKIQQLKIKKDLILIKNNYDIMTIEKLVESIDYFNKFIEEFKQTGDIRSMTPDDKTLLKDIWKMIYGRYICVNCPVDVYNNLCFLQGVAEQNRELIKKYKEESGELD